jgi:hypothetical protein
MSLEHCRSPRRHARLGCGRDLTPIPRRLKADLGRDLGRIAWNEIALVQTATFPREDLCCLADAFPLSVDKAEELAGIPIVFMVVQEMGDPLLQ